MPKILEMCKNDMMNKNDTLYTNVNNYENTYIAILIIKVML